MDIHPRQAALQIGKVGRGGSHLPRKKFKEDPLIIKKLDPIRAMRK
jgi:hypothetical protein